MITFRVPDQGRETVAHLAMGLVRPGREARGQPVDRDRVEFPDTLGLGSVHAKLA
jgi:hypothetical protein